MAKYLATVRIVDHWTGEILAEPGDVFSDDDDSRMARFVGAMQHYRHSHDPEKRAWAATFAAGFSAELVDEAWLEA